MNRINSRLAVSVLLWLTVVAVGLVTRPLLPMDETRYLAVAWEMWHRGDFLVPYLNGAPYSHKPPLLFWLMHAGWAVFGVNEITARLVAPLFGLGAVFATFRLARVLWPDDRAVADAAPLFLIGGAFWALFTSLTMFDMLLALFAATAVLGLVRAWRGGALAGFALVAVSVGLGGLAKGPAILLHVLPAALLAPLWAPRLAGAGGLAWGRWYAGVAAAVVVGVAITLAWAVPAGMAGGEAYRNAIFWGQSAGRVVDAFDHGRSWWWYLAVFPPLILPWLVWPALWRAVRAVGPGLAADGGLRLCLIWFAAAFVVFSAISGKQLHYLLPEFPPVALILAALLVRAEQAAGGGFWRAWDRRAPALLFIVLAGVAIFAVLAGLLPKWLLVGGPDAALPMVIVLAVGLALFKWRGGTAVERVHRLAAATAVLVVAVHFTLRPGLRTAFDLEPLARELKTWEDQGYVIRFYGSTYHGAFNFLGRLTKPIRIIYDHEMAPWLAATSKGKVISYRYRNPPTAAERPDAVQPFRSGFFVVWDAARHRDDQQVIRAD